MKTSTGKKQKRLENKCKKLAALREISLLNDKDRKRTKQVKVKISQSEDPEESPPRKKSCLDATGSNIEMEAVKKPSSSDDNGEVVNKKPKLDGEEYLKLKQELRDRKKILKSQPRLRLKLVGEQASLAINNPEDRIPIFLSDVQNLLLYSLLGHHSPYLPARWCDVEKYNKISHTVVLVIENLSMYHYIAHESLFSQMSSKLEHRLELITPAAYGESVIEELAAVPLTGTQGDRLVKEFGSLELALKNTGDMVKLLKVVFPIRYKKTKEDSDGKKAEVELPPTDKFPRTHLLLSPLQLVEENYPLPLKGALSARYSDYILTRESYDQALPTSPMFGLDCEMCKTTLGVLEVTRITVVAEDMKVVYESLVKPDNEIVDYLTQYSGITKGMLENVTIKLENVQRDLQKLLPVDAILVGQSLNSDLHALKMMHPYIIDTSVIFNVTGDRYRKTKLQVLAREFLNEKIQQGNKGHCSSEDSMASLKLVKLKLANSIEFGDAVLLGHRNYEMREANKSANSTTKEGEQYAQTIFRYATKEKKTAAIIGDQDVMSEYSKYLRNTSLSVMDDANFAGSDQVRLVIADSSKHAITRASQVAMEHAFTLCHVRIPDDKLSDDDKLEKTFQKIDKWVSKIWDHTALHALTCVVFAGHNSANGACFLNLKKNVTQHYGSQEAT